MKSVKIKFIGKRGMKFVTRGKTFLPGDVFEVSELEMPAKDLFKNSTFELVKTENFTAARVGAERTDIAPAKPEKKTSDDVKPEEEIPKEESKPEVPEEVKKIRKKIKKTNNLLEDEQ